MAKKEKLDRNYAERLKLAKRIKTGETIESFSRKITLKSVNINKEAIDPLMKYDVVVVKDNINLSGHGDTAVNAIVHIIKSMETMGAYFEEFSYTKEEAPELYNNDLIGANRIKSAPKKIKKTTITKKTRAKNRKTTKALPFL